MAEEGYSGYENWETWNVSLWLSNDEGLYYSTADIMALNPPRYSESAQIFIADEASKALEEYIDELLDENVITDKISTHRVNWQQVMIDFVPVLREKDGEYIQQDRTMVTDWKEWSKQVDKNPDGNYA
jgi:hypothetical protein